MTENYSHPVSQLPTPGETQIHDSRNSLKMGFTREHSPDLIRLVEDRELSSLLPIAAYVRIRPNPGQLPRVAELARSIPEIVECYRVTGEDCFILKVYLPGLDQLDHTGLTR